MSLASARRLGELPAASAGGLRRTLVSLACCLPSIATAARFERSSLRVTVSPISCGGSTTL
jgi:hypothetical protein